MHAEHEAVSEGGGVVRTFAVVAESHLGLAKTNGVLAGGNTVELFELSLLNILEGIGVSSGCL